MSAGTIAKPPGRVKAHKPFTATQADDAVRALPGRRRGDGRGAGEGLRHSEQALLRFLLRCCRNDAGDVGFMRGTRWIASELGYSYDAVRFARRRLVELGYVEITRPGTGEFASLYRVVVEKVRPAPAQANSEGTVRPDEKPVPDLFTEVIGSPPGGDRVTPSVGSVHPPTCARAAFLEVPSKEPPNPPPASPAGGESRCPTAKLRGRACENCRACGTTRRQIAAAAAAAAKAGRQVAHCGTCDPLTRLEELDDGTLRRCPACHPLRDELAAVAGDDLVDQWAYEHLADVADAGKLSSERETG